MARLPIADLPEHLQALRPADDDVSYQANPRPNQEAFDFHSESTPVEWDECEMEIGEWPVSFERETLKSFFSATGPLSGQGTSIEKLREIVPTAIVKAKALIPTLRVHLDLLEDNNRFWVWQALTQMLACFRRLQQSEPIGPDSDVIRGCAELAITRLEKVPTELPGTLPEGDEWSWNQKTSWEHALRLADEILTWPPAQDDQRLQSRFFEVIKAAFATENPMMQYICATAIRPYHWFLTEERRQLHHELLWNKPKHPSVLIRSLSHARYISDTDRAKLLKLLLNRSNLIDPGRLAGSLGTLVGVGSMQVLANGQRSAVAEIARRTIASPDSFPLLRDGFNRGEFLRSLIFGMKEQAKLVSSVHPQLAADYGSWSLIVWRIMRAQRRKRHESEGIVLFAMHWLKENSGQADRTHLKAWWRHLQPLFAAVIREGGRPDCFTLHFQLRSGEYNDLTTPEDLLGLMEEFVERIRTGALAGAMDLSQKDPADADYNSWRECAEHAAEAIESLRNDGSLRTDPQREQAHRLLSALATEPICSSKAVEGLHRLQTN